MLLPDGVVLPPLPHLLVLTAAVSAIAVSLVRTRPEVSQSLVVSLAPWMVAGACMSVLYVVGGLPSSISPFFGTPAVYVTTFAVAGAVWLTADRFSSVTAPVAVAASGVFAAAFVLGVTLWLAAQFSSISATWPAVGLAVSVALGAVVWTTVTRLLPETARETGALGALVVFGHTLDGVSTAIGIDILHFGERTPLARWIMEFAAGLPTADVLGVGWLFVLVKLTLAVVVVYLFTEYVRETPAEGYLLLGLVAAVGLGPGVHNLVLFTVG